MQLDEKYESDLTRKEKWQLEGQKLKKMTFVQKAEYLWTYYKAVLLVIVAVLLLVYTGMTIVKNACRKPVLSLVIADARTDKGREIAAWGKERLDGKTVAIDTSVTSKTDEASVIKTVIALSGELEDNDVVICGEEIYQKFAGEGAFLDISELYELDAKEYLPIQNGVLVLTDCDRWNDLEFTTGKPQYLCVLKNAPHKEHVREFIAYLWNR